MLSFLHKIGKKSKSGETKTDEAKASTEMDDAYQALPAVLAAVTAQENLQTRSCEGMLLKPYKPKISEPLSYYPKYSDQVKWGKKLKKQAWG